MRIGVISDTHIPRAADWLPKKVCEDLKNVDLILHAGDITEKEVLERLKAIAPTRAVYGNMDSGEVRDLLPRKDIIDIGRFRIGLIHGFGPPFGMIERIRKEFGKMDAIVFGHTHAPMNEVKSGCLFFNPGSPTEKIFTKENAYGIIEIGKELKGEIIDL